MLLENKNLLQTSCYLNGTWCKSNSNETIAVYNPANNEKIATVPLLDPSQVQQTIFNAGQAFTQWSHRTAYARAEILLRWHDLILQNKSDIATIITTEQGKPLTEAVNEVEHAATFLSWFVSEAKRVEGKVIPSPSPNSTFVTAKQPLGVVAAITPWNFPVSMILRKIAAALAVGCCVIVKPSELTPLSALSLAFLAHKAHIPAGVFNVITGDPKSIGDSLTRHKIIKKISFTGSTAVGKILAKKSLSNITRLSLELGGHAPFIVFEDANIDQAVTGLLKSKLRNSGQTCICPNRIYLHHSIYRNFMHLLLREIAKIKLGQGLDSKTDCGPLINSAAVAKIHAYVKDALDKGARLTYGGKTSTCGVNFFEPTILEDIPTDALLLTEEVFGPIIPILGFHTDDEVIQQANNSDYGLASYFYTNDLNRAHKIAAALESGLVAINSYAFSAACVPFGGSKQSGFGYEGGHQGINEYLSLKLIKTDFTI